MQIKFFPHSWLSIVADGYRIQIDPAYLDGFFNESINREVFGRLGGEIDGLPEPIEKADLILITHADRDHFNPKTIRRLSKEGTLIFGPPSCVKDFSPMERILPGEKIDYGQISIEAVHAYNTPSGNSTRKHHTRENSLGYILNINGKRIYHAGDTDLIPEMGRLKNIEAAFLPIGGIYTMDISEAVQSAAIIQPSIVVPIHYRLLGVEPYLFIEQLKAQEILSKGIVLELGESLTLGEGELVSVGTDPSAFRSGGF